MDKDTLKEVRTLRNTVAFVGLIILIYNLYWIGKFDLAFNIFTEESFVMIFVGLVMIFPAWAKLNADIRKPERVDKLAIIQKKIDNLSNRQSALIRNQEKLIASNKNKHSTSHTIPDMNGKIPETQNNFSVHDMKNE